MTGTISSWKINPGPHSSSAAGSSRIWPSFWPVLASTQYPGRTRYHDSERAAELGAIGLHAAEHLARAGGLEPAHLGANGMAVGRYPPIGKNEHDVDLVDRGATFSNLGATVCNINCINVPRCFYQALPQKGTKLNLPAASADGGLTVEKSSHIRIAFLRARGRNCDSVSPAAADRCGVQRAEH
jgi:hypothetical protein